MAPGETIAAIVAAYVAVIVLLLCLYIGSRWKWWLKALAILLCGAFFIVNYMAIKSLLGWPTQDQVPTRFNLLATRVVEPDNISGEAGSVFFWLEHMNDDNIPSGQPLSYQMRYSDAIAQAADKAQEMIDQGTMVEATLTQVQADANETTDTDTPGSAESPPQSGGGGGESVEGYHLVINNMPPVKLPGKGPL